MLPGRAFDEFLYGCHGQRSRQSRWGQGGAAYRNTRCERVASGESSAILTSLFVNKADRTAVVPSSLQTWRHKTPRNLGLVLPGGPSFESSHSACHNQRYAPASCHYWRWSRWIGCSNINQGRVARNRSARVGISSAVGGGKYITSNQL